MKTRARPFADTANWAYAVITLALLWYGFSVLFNGAFSFWSQSAAVVSNPDKIDTFIAGSTPAAVRWTMATFAIYTALLLVMTRTLHGIGLRGLIGAPGAAWRQFWRVSLYLSPLYVVLLLPSTFELDTVKQYTLATWLMILPAMLPLLFVQISAEELVFRGYLQSHLAALSRSPIIWMGLPSFLFGLIHYDTLGPAYPAWAYVVWATCFGLVCADLTARSGTLGPAFAVHFVNNFGALLILAADDWLYGAALYVWPMYGQAWEPWVPYEALALLTAWLAARLALRR